MLGVFKFYILYSAFRCLLGGGVTLNYIVIHFWKT